MHVHTSCANLVKAPGRLQSRSCLAPVPAPPASVPLQFSTPVARALPRDEDHSVWQKGARFSGQHLHFQEWRAYRAHLVQLERKEAAWSKQTQAASTTSGDTLFATPSTSGAQDSNAQHSPLVVRRPNLPATRRQRGTARTNATQGPVQPGSEPSPSIHWAHDLPGPEVGSILLARSGLADMGALFHKSVVLLLPDDDASDCVGVILNKPSSLTVGEAPALTQLTGYRDVLGAQRLMLGGPVNLDHITVLHRFRGLPGALCVADGLFIGGLPGAAELIQAGLASPSDFLVCLGLSRWSPLQLDREVRAGLWHCAAASPDLLVPAPENRRLRMHLSDMSGLRSETQSPHGDRQAQGGICGAASDAHMDSGNARRRAQGAASSPHRTNTASSTGPLHRGGVPPLLPPPVHPANPPELCLWRKIMSLAQLA